MKKLFNIITLTIIGAFSLFLVSCQENEINGETMTIMALNEDAVETEIVVPKNPERIAILDLASLDILDQLNLGDRVVGCADTTIDYLEKYNTSSIANIGNIKTPDLEATLECEPDIIFIGGRLKTYYTQLEKIAPVVYLATDVTEGLVKSTAANAKTIASIFGLEDEVDELVSGFETRLNAINEISAGMNAVVGMVTSGSFNTLSNTGRCSLIGVEAGFNNLAAEADGGAHGNETSFEYLLRVNPEFIFVMDRDQAIGTSGAQTAQQVFDNEIVKMTYAYQNGNIIYLEHSNVWYTAEGGINALNIMITDLESALINSTN